MPGKLLPLLLVSALLWCGGCSVNQKGSNGNDDVKIQTPLGDLKVKTNNAVDISEIGIPVYPGATPVQEEKSKDSADVDLSFGNFRLRVKTATYRTPDSMEKVRAFYRDKLAHFGTVLECRDDYPLPGSPTHTPEGLTCGKNKDNAEGKGFNLNIAGKDGIELKTGSKTHQHIVALENEAAGTKLKLVELNLPGSGESN